MSQKINQLAQADLLLLLAQLLAPPSDKTFTLLQQEVTDIQALADNTGISNASNLESLYQQLRQYAENSNLEELTEEHTYLFEGGVACPINESGFIRRDKGAILADIAGFYRAFGFQLAENATEKADHLICELEFAALLLVMLSRADDETSSKTTHQALASFQGDHLGEWITAFCDKLTNTTSLAYYQLLSQLLEKTWDGIVTANQLPLPESTAEPISDEQGTPYECDVVPA